MKKKRIFDIVFLLILLVTAVGLLLLIGQTVEHSWANDDKLAAHFAVYFGLLLTGHCLVQETVIFFSLRYLVFSKERSAGKTVCAWVFLALAVFLLAYPCGVLLGIIPYGKSI